jgi:hypothetical protein
MKRTFRISLFLSFLVLNFSCDQEEVYVAEKGQVAFIIGQHENPAGRISGVNAPAAVLLSITDKDGKIIFENKKLSLVEFGQGFISESIQIDAGQYRLTKFLVLNSNNQVMYATPLEGSDKAQYVTDPLPISFTVSDQANVEVVPQVLAVAANDTPQNFGYVSFGFQVVDGNESFKIRVRVEVRIGDILYQNVNAIIKVTGYDSSNVVKLTEHLPYTGPNSNDITIKGKHARYSFEVKQLGVYDRQVIERSQLWEGRADGPSTVTYVLGGSAPAKKVAHYINYFEKPDSLTGILFMEPQYKIAHEFNSAGKIQKILHYGYSSKKNDFSLERYASFTYSNGLVERIAHYFAHNDQLSIEYTYRYDNNGNVSKISEKNLSAGVNSEVSFGYDFLTGMVSASYTFSNGGSFVYQFFYTGKNIVSEKTSRFGILCSDGAYTYDKNVNPLKHLGYVDYSLRNHSINNRLTEDIHYHGCAFPTLMPKTYTYEYDADGYPKIATTNYQSGAGQRRAQTRYFYQ